jgi:lipopolysaccharide/colanic/teichoic acid biosynthesis glycosyltransferase
MSLTYPRFPRGGTSSDTGTNAQEPPGLAGLRADPAVAATGVRANRRSWLPALIAADAVSLAAACFIGTLMGIRIDGDASVAGALSAVPYALVFLPVLSGYGLYRRARRRLVASIFPDLSQLFHSVVVGSLIILLINKVAHETAGLALLDRKSVTLVAAWSLILVPFARAGTRWALRPSHRADSRVIVVGSGQVASTVVQRLTNVYGMQLVGCVDDGFYSQSDPGQDAALLLAPEISMPGREPDPIPLGATKLLGGLDDLPAIVAANNVDHIIVAFSPASGAKLANLLRSLADDVQISVVPRLFDLLTVRSHVDDLHGLPVVDVAPAALGPADRFAKRALDIVLSALGLLVLLPPSVVIAAAVKATSPGTVLFRQQRTGRSGETFRITKFRTMRSDAERERGELSANNQVDGPLFKIHDDPRITRVGAFLRKTSLDEIPQLLNVFMGDMSLVGPRPFVTKESAEIDGWAARRFAVRPGMTGLWQISGRNDLPFDELRRLDYSYVASWSLWWDLRILWHTPASVLGRHGAY